MPTRPKVAVAKFRNLKMPGEKIPAVPAKPETPSPVAPPDYLEPEARLHWQQIVREMQTQKTWSSLFETTLAIYCTLLADYHASPGSFGASKLVQLRLLAGDLGLTPSHVHRVAKS